MQEPLLKIGDKVRIKTQRDRVGVVQKILDSFNNITWYEVFFSAYDIQNLPEQNLEHADEKPGIKELLYRRSFAGKEALSKLITFIKLQTPLSNTLYALGASRTQFFGYQFKPLLKFLESQNRRLLIADEVGLGKTIEAGLILIEEKARHDLSRILIVCPSALREKWQMELKNRFDEHFEIFDATKMREYLKMYDEEGESAHLKAICSLQTLRNQSLLEDLEAASPLDLDIVIVDEAHHMRNRGTNSNQLGTVLSDTTDVMLLLTATPVHIGNENLYNLLRILDESEFDNLEVFNGRLKANEPVVRVLRRLSHPSEENIDLAIRDLEGLSRGLESEWFVRNPIYEDVLDRIKNIRANDREAIIELQSDINRMSLLSHVLSRTKKRDVHDAAKRTAHVVKVRFSENELDFYNAVTDFVIEQTLKGNYGGITPFVLMMPQRQIASCLPVVAKRYLQEIAEYQFAGIDEEQSDIIPEEIGGNNLDNEYYEGNQSNTKAYNALIEAARKVQNSDSKYDKLIEALREIERVEAHRKIIIFSYFKKTLYYLQERLKSDGFNNSLINGDVPVEERTEVIDKFKNDENIQVLLSSEVGSEGLDFQFCHIVINYDLPWNPMIVEQRIGRVDRIGQKSARIIIYNLSVANTIEDIILERLYNRIHIFESSIGDLEAILGDEINQLRKELLTSKLTQHEREQRVEESARRIMRKQKDLVELEKNATKLIGYDQYFDDQINNILVNKRYITADELYVFVNEYLTRHLPKCTLQKTGKEGVYKLFFDDSLRDKIREYLSVQDKYVSKFLVKLVGKFVELTFSDKIAYENDQIEFINNRHPLIQLIKHHYRKNSDELHPITKLQLNIDLIPPGNYFYFVYKLDIQAVRNESILELIAVSEKDKSVVESAKSDLLLEDIITTAETLEYDPLYERDVIDEVVQLSEGEMHRRLHMKKKQYERTNTALIENQLESLRRSYEIRRMKKETLLGQAYEKKRAPQYIRMLEGGLRNLEDDYKRKESELNEKRNVTESFRWLASGIIVNV